MSGLGIDFGQGGDPRLGATGSAAPPQPCHHPAPSQRQQPEEHKKKRTTVSQSAAASKERPTALPKKSSFSKLRRPTTADNRRVRIASGEPGVLGHSAYTDEDFLSPSSAAYSSGSEDVVIRPQPPNSLSAAALAFSGPPSDRSLGESSHTSDQASSSPATMTSMTSYSSESSGRGRSKTLKKHASQPQLSRSSTIKAGSNKAPPPASSKAISRSLSSASLSSSFKSDSGSSLGRSSEIPRSGSRNGSVRCQSRAYGRGGSRANRAPPPADQGDTPVEPSPSQASQQSLPRDSETEATPSDFSSQVLSLSPRKAASVRSHTASSTSGSSSVAGRPCFDGPSLLSRISMDDTPRSVGQGGGYFDDASIASQQIAPNLDMVVGSTVGDSVADPAERPAQWRVGSFYAPNGVETGRIDASGRLSTSMARTATLANKSSIPSSASSDSRRSRSNSVGAPRATLMTSPPQAHPEMATQQSVPLPFQPNSASGGKVRTMSMRSARGLRGLEGAERGEAMVSFDRENRAFETGLPIMPGNVETADQQSLLASTQLNFHDDSGIEAENGVRAASSAGYSAGFAGSVTHSEASSHGIFNRSRRSLSEAAASTVALDRQGTLLSTGANPIRRSKELNRLLGNSGRKLPASAASAPETAGNDGDKGKAKLQRSNAVGGQSVPPAALEQGKAGKARVEVDLVLESDLVVEGGTMKGRMQIKLRKGVDKEGAVMLAQPKIRVVGFEELLNDDTRHIFYHHASVIDGDRSSGGPSEPYYLHGSPTFSSPEARGHSSLPCYESSPDSEGFAVGKEGTHSIPFSLDLPIAKGAKGSYRGKNAVVRYIVIGSVKLKSAGGSNRSIAHFYRHIELYPYLNPAVVLSSAPRPIQASTSKGLFLGGSGKVHLTASLHRTTWVAGQRVYVSVAVSNETNKKINSMTLSLIRTVTLFRPRPELDVARRSDGYYDPDACQTSTTRKKISEEALEMGQKGSKGVVTAKGWWTGVETGGSVDFSYYMSLPNDALSIARGRHVEVAYTIKVSVGSSLFSDVSVELPLRVVNFVSLDPPPLRGMSSTGKSPVDTDHADRVRSWTQIAGSGASVDPMIARVKSIEALRSPSKAELSLHGGDGPYPQMRTQATEENEQERNRRLQHQKSLDFINHAIRSATARRGAAPPNAQKAPLGLGIAIADELPQRTPESHSAVREGDEALASLAVAPSSLAAASPGNASSIGPIHPSCLPYESEDAASVSGVSTMLPRLRVINAVSLDEVGDDFDESDPDRTLGLNDDSVEEVDLVIGSAKIDHENSPDFGQAQDRHSDHDITAPYDDAEAFEQDDAPDDDALEEVTFNGREIGDIESDGDEIAGEEGKGMEEGEEEQEGGEQQEEEEEDEDECMEMIPEMEEADCSATPADSWLSDDDEVEEHWKTDEQEDVSEVSRLMQVIPQSKPGAARQVLDQDIATSNVATPPPRPRDSPGQVKDSQGGRTYPTGTASVGALQSPRKQQLARPLSLLPPAKVAPTSEARSSTMPLKLRPAPSSPAKAKSTTPPSPVKDKITMPLSPVKTKATLPPSPTKAKATMPPSPQKLTPKVATPTSPQKAALRVVASPSPQKPVLKKKSSFTFATDQTPLKTVKETPKASTPTPTLRAKMSFDQIATPATAVRAPREQSKLPEPSKFEAEKVATMQEKPRKRGDSSNGRSRSRARKGSDTPSDTTASSPASSASAETPESVCNELTRIAENPRTLFDGGDESGQNPDCEAVKEAAPAEKPQPLADRVSMLPRSISSKGERLVQPDQVDGRLKHSVSTTDLCEGTIKRSHSTHNLRGSSIVVPSVRNKIAMLENRNQALKEFTGTANRPPALQVTGFTTPTKGPGRVAQLAASAEKARQQSESTSPLRLVRKESTTSIASSEASTVPPDYLKRSASIMSFKAPMLRSTKQ
ncbi:hypothetical protein ACQY0O_000293 [Thecaphora frezii]